MNEEQLREVCAARVRELLRQAWWGLARDEAAFITEVWAEVQKRVMEGANRPFDKIVQDAAIHRYGYLWYARCRSDDPKEQQEALVALYEHLYAVALNASRDRAVAEESAQKAWASAWRNLERVRDPGSFVRWAGQIARREVARVGHQQTGVETEALSLADSKGEVSTERLTANRTSMGPEMLAAFEGAIRQCLRGEQQQRVIIALLLEQRSAKELAEELGKSPQYIYEVKSRALARLKQCGAMRGLYAEIMEDGS